MAGKVCADNRDMKRLTRKPNPNSLNDQAKEALEQERLELKRRLKNNKEIADGMSALWYLPVHRTKKAHGYNNPVYWVAWAKNGRHFATTGNDKHCAIWETLRYTNVRRLRRHSGPVRQCAWSPCSLRLATCAEAVFYVWDAEGGELMAEIRDMHKDLINTIDWSPNGNMIATGSNDKEVRIWAVSKVLGPPTIDRGCVMTCSTGDQAHGARVHRVAFAPDSERCLSASADCTVKMWHLLRAGVCERTFSQHKDSVLGLSWNKDGSRFASASHDGTVCIWNPESPTPLHVLRSTGHIVYGGAFGPEATARGGRLVAVGHFPEMVMWDTRQGKKLNTFKLKPKGWTLSVAFSPDGKKIVTTSTEGNNSMIIYEAQPVIQGFWGFILWISRKLRSYN
mmetsp:Transcript_14783/g.23291  ORF Transcript_14783/g.23291 Transcript_14783/m.23291 type:complete len:395 (-) Transcript_14783:412-1596(-)